MIILGIETSCDETAAAVVKAEKDKISVLSNIVSSQVKLHAKWGGVVPNLAAREHVKNILPVIEESLKKAKISPKEIDLITVTQGPGLIPALLIGVDAAKTLSYLWKKPLVGIHHIEGHIYANFISPTRDKVCAISNFQFPISKKKSKFPEKASGPRGFTGKIQNSKFPILCLVVSGGHTQLVLMKKHQHYEIIGETQDDAVGEAFDKVARILGLGYPGGPIISNVAKNYKLKIESHRLALPRPMINSNNFNFSFSGLKTAVLYQTKKQAGFLENKKYISAMSYEFQQAVIDVLVSKTISAAKEYKPETIMLAGGVAANKELREQLGKAIADNLPDTGYEVPEMEYTGDNAAMIATAAYFRFKNIKDKGKLRGNWKKMEADAGLKLK